MSWKTPLVADGFLRDQRGTPRIALDSADWFKWLGNEQHCAFHFTHPAGGFTARKERKQRGQWYWVAYRQVHCRLHKTYLGKSETLTQDHLCEVSEQLAAHAAEPPGPENLADRH